MDTIQGEGLIGTGQPPLSNVAAQTLLNGPGGAGGGVNTWLAEHQEDWEPPPQPGAQQQQVAEQPQQQVEEPEPAQQDAAAEPELEPELEPEQQEDPNLND